ncbi:MAG: hypothetical protein KIT14_17350 [bacterium]|nr:hypothetical protein [bacterium]
MDSKRGGKTFDTGGVLGLALMLAVVGAATSAGAHGSNPGRALLRCQEQITSEGLGYTNRLNGKLARCLLPLGECAVENAGRPAACARAVQRCRSLPADVRALGDRLVARTQNACNGVAMSKLLGDLGFAAQMADCAPKNTREFAVCLMGDLQEAEAIAMLRLAPAACGLLEAAGLRNVVPASLCTPGGSCEAPEPPTCENQYCGGPDGLGCPAGMVCNRHDAMCGADAAGVCVPAPAACEEASPVCGCDGQTYASDCARLVAGVTQAYDGACTVETACTSSAQCGAGGYCEFPSGDCGESQTGVCRPMNDPSCEMCVEYAMGQVCGCDGVNYPSECARRAAGVSKLADGYCFTF